MQQLQSSDEAAIKSEQIRIKGTIQGVGYRPFVWRLACELDLRGRVWNDAEGVVIQVWGELDSLNRFRDRLFTDAPPLANIESVTASPLSEISVPDEFQIIESRQGRVQTNISPDVATCPQCLVEISDPSNRRYRYPFTNCTHCGPRFSIIRSVPYDRHNTSMAVFPMCPQCQQEYDNPADRRFHAQPNACPVCGPSMWLEDKNGQRKSADYIDDIAHAASLIQQGYIVAIKGIGGFHLACDATNDAAVSQLRQRKQRYHKPFAMMARDVAVIRRYAHVSKDEVQLLKGRAAPIVVLSMHDEQNLSSDVAPEQVRLGFMLPYTPLHSLLLHNLDFPVVLTSGNRSDEAQCISNEQAREQLSGIADYFLLHDRDIVNRLDDSVTRIIDHKPQLLRRARGYAPQPLELPAGFDACPDILAMGAELKNTFCLLKDGKAIVSQHQGDLEDSTVLCGYRDSIDLYTQLYDHHPSVIAVDCHPNYISTRIGEELAAQKGIALHKIQHHHAHMAACMVEHHVPLNSKPVLGICLDGLGYGGESELWGGEFILADYCMYQRLARFDPVAMPGGVKAILEPWRNSFAHLEHSLGWQQVVAQYPELSFVNFMQQKPVNNLLTMICKGLNSPPSSSAGRLFDAVAALLGLCRDVVSYEGQAAIQLEALAEQTFADVQPYCGDFITESEKAMLTLQWHSLWRAILSDIHKAVPANCIAGRFHQTLASLLVATVTRLSRQHDFDTVILAGGVMQNRLLSEQLISLLRAAGITVMIARQLPANDGGLSLGQAAISAVQFIKQNA